jgi:LysR family nitrogen assimilation transcriptional regulator
MRGVSFQPLLVEEFFLVTPAEVALPGTGQSAIALAELAGIPLMLPSKLNFVRRAVDAGFAAIHLTPNLVAEVESLETLRDAVAEGAGSTILPWSVACQIAVPSRSVVRAITSPRIEETVSVCVSDQMPLSEAAVAIRNVVLDIAMTAARSGRWQAPKDVAG